MYSKTLEPKVSQMFAEISAKASDIIETSFSKKDACDRIAELVGAETATRSMTMLSDMYAALSTQVLDSISDVAKQNRFYEANLRQEIFEKYNFSVPSGGIDFKEANRVLSSIAVGAGTVIVGGLLVYALSPVAPVLPIAIVVAASISVFCVSYLKVTPGVNKSNFKAAVNKYLSEVKASFIAWFEEVECYFFKRAEDILRSF